MNFCPVWGLCKTSNSYSSAAAPGNFGVEMGTY